MVRNPAPAWHHRCPVGARTRRSTVQRSKGAGHSIISGRLVNMSNRKGFTLIELLIVVVIIGILAAIAIPKFAATKDKAKLASVKTDLRNSMTAQEAYFSDYATYGTRSEERRVGKECRSRWSP